MRKKTLLATLVVANFATACMGLPLTGEGGKFSASNIGPMVFTAIAGMLFFSTGSVVDRRLLAFLLLFNLGCFASFIVFMLRFSWDPNFPVLMFQDLEIIFCMLLWWYGRGEPQQFSRAVRAGILCSIPVLAYFAWDDTHARLPWLAFGMDDKSQAAVLLCCESYILIRFFGGPLDRILGVGLYLATFLTVSRLPVFFLLPVFLAKCRGSRYAPVGAVITLVLVGAALLEWGDAIKEFILVYDRLSSVSTDAPDDSTTAHLLLLQSAMEIKLSDPLTFLLGIGPGNFSKALMSFPVSLSELQASDPEVVAYAFAGRAPLHSMTAQILLDYNFAVFLAYVCGALQVFRYLWRRRIVADLAFFMALALAASFYSLHNKPYFFLMAATAALLNVNEADQLLSQETQTNAEMIEIKRPLPKPIRVHMTG
jgi:hypothetical protein